MRSRARHQRPYRVVHLVERLDRGGLEDVVATLATGMDPARFRVEVWTLAGDGPVAADLREAGVPVRRAEAGRPAARPAFVSRLARELRRNGTAVVHGHGWLAGTLARCSGRLAGVPCRIHHRHTLDEGEGRRHRWLERFLSRHGRTVCCSDAVRARVVLDGGVDPLSAEVVYNGVDLERFSPADPAGGSGIVCVASLRRLKGHRVLLEALALLRTRGIDLSLTLVGNGPARNGLKAHVHDLGLNGFVGFAGETDDVLPFLRSAALFVLPSVEREGLSLATIEAMACELPVVASRVGGLPEVVEDGRTGILVDPGDPGALAYAIESIHADPQRSRVLGREGRIRAEARFSAKMMVRAVEKTYLRDLEPPDSRRTVLFLSSRGTRYGGGQEGLRLVASGLSSSGGYRGMVASPEPGGLNADLAASGVPTFLVPMPTIRSWKVHRPVLAALRLRRLVRRENVALVHVDSTRGATYALALPRGVRRVWHLRDIRPDRWDRLLGSRFHRLIAVSEAAARRFPNLPDGRVEILPNAVEATRPSRRRTDLRSSLGLEPDETVILSVGRVEQEKGIEDLIRAASLLDEDLPTRILVAGRNMNGEVDRLSSLARDLGLGESVRFLGWRNDVFDLMAAADILVHPSLFEAAPRVVLEAMFAGLPVVATDVGGTREILGDCGVLVPPRDPGRIAATIRDLASDVQTRRQLAQKAAQRCRERFSPSLHLDRVEGLYDGLLEEEAS